MELLDTVQVKSHCKYDLNTLPIFEGVRFEMGFFYRIQAILKLSIVQEKKKQRGHTSRSTPGWTLLSLGAWYIGKRLLALLGRSRFCAARVILWIIIESGHRLELEQFRWSEDGGLHSRRWCLFSVGRSATGWCPAWEMANTCSWCTILAHRTVRHTWIQS